MSSISSCGSVASRPSAWVVLSSIAALTACVDAAGRDDGAPAPPAAAVRKLQPPPPPPECAALMASATVAFQAMLQPLARWSQPRNYVNNYAYEYTLDGIVFPPG